MLYEVITRSLPYVLAEPRGQIGDFGVDLVLGDVAFVDEEPRHRCGPTLVIGKRVVGVVPEHLDIAPVFVGPPNPP